MVKRTVALAGLVSPAAIAVAKTVCSPSARAETGLKTQEPVEAVVTAPATALSKVRAMVLPGSAVPKMAGLLSVTVASWVGERMTGAAGPTTVVVQEWLAGKGSTLPTTSRVSTRKVCCPSARLE
jgi:hypothetical protein